MSDILKIAEEIEVEDIGKALWSKPPEVEEEEVKEDGVQEEEVQEEGKKEEEIKEEGKEGQETEEKKTEEELPEITADEKLITELQEIEQKIQEIPDDDDKLDEMILNKMTEEEKELEELDPPKFRKIYRKYEEELKTQAEELLLKKAELEQKIIEDYTQKVYQAYKERNPKAPSFEKIDEFYSKLSEKEQEEFRKLAEDHPFKALDWLVGKMQPKKEKEVKKDVPPSMSQLRRKSSAKETSTSDDDYFTRIGLGKPIKEVV